MKSSDDDAVWWRVWNKTSRWPLELKIFVERMAQSFTNFLSLGCYSCWGFFAFKKNEVQ